MAKRKRFSGSALRDARTKLQLTQEELAERIGTQKQAISRYELGEVTPDLDTIGALCEALKCEIAELLA